MTSNYNSVVSADSPIRHYRLNDTGTSAVDTGSQAQNGTLHGTITKSVAGLIRGDSDNCMTFDGSTGYISLPTTSLPTGASTWSLEAWVKVAAIPASGYHTLVGFGTQTAQKAAMLMIYSNGTTCQFLCSTYSGDIGGPYTIATGNVYHAVATYDGTSTRLYMNGALVAGPTAFTLTIALAFASIGADGTGPGDWTAASIDEPAIYSSCLSAQQVLNHYLAGIAAKVVGARTRISVLNTKTLGSRIRLRVQNTLSLGSRARVAVLKTVSLGSRTRLGVLVSKSLGSRTRLRILNTKTLGARTRLITAITKSVGVRTLLRVLSTKTIGVRLVLHSFAAKVLGARTRLSVLVSKSAGARTLLRVLKTKSLGARLVLHSFASRTLGLRTRLSVLKSVVIGVRLHLFISLTKSVGVRVRIAGIANGKFGVWANGTGTATYSYFRATQFPDPALSLAPVMPRLGTSLVQWDANTTTAATLGMDVSTDGVNWQDVSAGLAMTFDGSTGYISLPTTSLPTGASSWSLEAWCQTSTIPSNGYHALVGFGTQSAQKEGVLFIQSNGTTAQFTFSTFSGDISGPATFAANVIYHVVGTYDGTATRLYVNGVLVAGPTNFTLNIALAYASIGADGTGPGDWCAGTIDEAAIYSSALSATQVFNHYNAGIATPTSNAYATTVLADNPIRYYRLEDTNTTSIDSGSQGQNGTLHGTIVQRVVGLIASRNGLQLPQYYVQPDPTTDGFTSNTSANYTSTFRTGGAALAPTWDTAHSRLILTGGTNGILYYATLSRADVDFLVDMDQSDTGGVVWRFNNASNYYWLDINDTQASSGTPNTATLYRVASNVQTQLATATLSATVGAESRLFWRGSYRRFRVAMLGSTVTVSMDGQQLINYTDASPLAGAGTIGLYNNGGSIGSRYYQLWIQPQGDNVTGSPAGDIVSGQFVYTRQRLATSDPTATAQVLDLTTIGAGPNIRSGVQLASIAYNSAYIGKSTDDLAKTSNYDWSIGCESNGTQTLNFAPGTARPAPWILQSTQNGLPSDMEHDTNLIVETADNTLYRNRQTLTNVIGNDPFVDTFTGDGKTTSFTLRYKIASGYVPMIVLNNNVAQTIGLKGTTGSQWYYAPNDAVIAQDASGTAIVLGDTNTLVVAYQGTFTTSVTVDNLAAQAALRTVQGGSGIVEDVEDVSSLGLNTVAATTYAQQLITRYCIPGGRTVTYKTYRNGINEGMIQPAFFPEFNMTDTQLLITEVDWYVKTTQINGSIVSLYGYVITGSELPYTASWSKLIASNLLTNTTGTIS